ncbi:sigma-70 family RNA polymerase sigma factor [Clostridium sp.]|uniref:sigma-70 family RNA polymerase sigma factor n=1 Tax=Clostridium sp. TaxID=1506 RepID=UPI003F325B35
MQNETVKILDSIGKAQIIKKYDNVIREVCNCFYIKNYGQDDLYQIGYIEAISVIDKFDSEKGISFSSFLRKCIRNQMINLINKECKKYGVSFSSDDEEYMIPVVDDIQSEIDIEEEYVRREFTKALISIINGLSKEQRILLKNIYVDGISLNEYAVKNGVTYYKAAKIQKEMLKGLLNKIEVNWIG